MNILPTSMGDLLMLLFILFLIVAGVVMGIAWIVDTVRAATRRDREGNTPDRVA